MRRLPPLLLALTVVAATACDDADPFPELSARRAAALPLMETVRTNDDSLFQEPTGIDVDSRGRIYVADWQAARVLVLDPSGARIGSLGRRGLGPGEFRAVRGVQVLPGDSILAWDPVAARISVFPPDGDRPARTVNLFEVPGGAPFRVWRAPGGEGYAALTRPAFRDGEQGPRLDHLLLLDARGRPRGDPLRTFPSHSFLRVEQGRGFSVMPNPFGHQGFVAVGSERIAVARSDTLGVALLDAQGGDLSRFQVRFLPLEVTRSDLDAALGALPEQMARTFSRVLADSAPSRWPPLRGLHDDGTLLWLGISGPLGAPAEWAAFSEDGGYRGSVFVPAGTTVQAIRGGRVYGFVPDALDRPQLLVFTVGAR